MSDAKDFPENSNAIHLFDCETETSFSIRSPDSKSEKNCHFSEGMLSKKKISAVINWILKILFVFAACIIALRLCFPSEGESASLRTTNTNDSDYCGGNGWIAYRDETCFKLITKWANREEAEATCRQEQLPIEPEIPHLASIKSYEEQSFLEKLMFNDSKLDVWIGARRNSNNQTTFVWEDDSPVAFTVWDSVTDLFVEKDCVEMHQTATSSRWRLADCQQANYFVCQKPQRWPLKKLQRAFLNNRRDQHRVNAKFEDPFPVGFIYVQLPEQRSPLELWSKMDWIDVSGNYSGVFFRVVGGDSGDFGIVQEENAGGEVTSATHFGNDGPNTVTFGKGSCSNVRSGGKSGGWTTLEFCKREGEVRPRNMAIKIWKRIE